ncbi:hypothetical protein R5R35_012634 [Gryllus longicercus]|uniref:DNA 3'-5' helicase n=1 Tax=Gryllus longicercus TaxID=2509291 RepID=A0AAN9YUW9_9ORTH
MTNVQNQETNYDFRSTYDFKKFTETGLRAIEEIPPEFRHIFSMYPSFNAFQSKVMDEILYSDKPVVISAPTGSGKTVLFELAITNLLIKMSSLKHDGNFMIIYMAPIKALCSERLRDWQYKFSPLGLKCQEVTGDSDSTLIANMSSFNIVLTTPEKWDSLTRTWKDNKKMVQTIKLFLLDEIHLLNDEQRGPVLEAVVSRMKTIHEAIKDDEKLENRDKRTLVPTSIRFIAVSATIPNIEDVASWLGDVNNPAQYFSLGEAYRPVKLHKVVMGYHYPHHTEFRFDMQLSYKLRQLLLQYSEGKPSLIFCSTRKGVTQTADVLMKQVTFHFNNEQKRKLDMALDNIKENAIKKSLAAGIGCHHAGMDLNDRHIIEDLFRNGGLPVLITTSTLAMGVNLPAHLVIIKSTQQYTSNGYQEYSSNQILQMIGRAGRPQYDTHATAIIMTQQDKILKYESLVSGTDILESNLHHHLAEHLNAEIVLSTIPEKAVAINWIRSTFLYVRALCNPSHYGISGNLNKTEIEGKLHEMCMIEMNALANTQLVKMDVKYVWPTETGKLMAQHYMSLETMKIFSKITGKETIPEMLNIVMNCQEFADFKLRVNEKRSLNFLNKSIRFPIKSLIKTSQMKINCLIQAVFGGLVVHEPSLQQEAIQIVRIGIRITKCLTRFLSLQDKYLSLLSATILSKCFQCNLWEDSPLVSRQLEGIGAVLSQLLVSAGKTSFRLIAESNPRDLERIINRTPPMGNRLQTAALHMPQYTLDVREVVEQFPSKLNISIKLNNYEDIKNFSTPGFYHNLVIIAGDSNNKLLLYKRFQEILLINNDGFYSWLIQVENKQSSKIFIHLISENWVGMDVKTNITLKGSSPKVLLENETVNNQPNVKETVDNKMHVEKRKSKKIIQNSIPIHQFQKKSTRISKKSTKKLSTKLIKKQIQIDLTKYILKPKNIIKVNSTSTVVQEIPSSERAPTKTTNLVKQSDNHTYNQKQCLQSTNSLSKRFMLPNDNDENKSVQNLLPRPSQRDGNRSSPSQNLEFHIPQDKEINVQYKNGKNDEEKLTSNNDNSLESLTVSQIVINEKLKLTKNTLLSGENKDFNNLQTITNRIEGSASPLLQRSSYTHYSTQTESLARNSYSKYYPIFVKAASNTETRVKNNEHILSTGETNKWINEKEEIVDKHLNPTETTITFDLGIEKLLEPETQETENKKTASYAPDICVVPKPKQLDLTNPVTKLLYGNRCKLENRQNSPTSRANFSPLSEISPNTVFGKLTHLQAQKNISSFDSENFCIPHGQGTANFIPISPTPPSQHLNCTLDALEFLKNSDETYKISSENNFSNKQIMGTNKNLNRSTDIRQFTSGSKLNTKIQNFYF